MSWGNKLLLTFVVFAGMMSYMVYRCVQTPIDLVTKEYYRDELSYQQVIDSRRQADALKGRTSLHQEAESIVLTLPEDMKGRRVIGTVLFYCPADASKDKEIELAVGDDVRQVISARALAPGRYLVKINWKCADKNYYTEQGFVII
jgi:nitrogen fixation protein FixH